ncbi:MAG: MaoC family dehydratase [Pseudomonadota bacterium]
MSAPSKSYAALAGLELGCSDWHVITQDQIDLFAKASFDPDPMHIDPEHAGAGPFGSTIAFGFQTMALLTFFSHQVFDKWTDKIPELGYALNYGFNRVRMISPVRVNSRVRGRFKIVDAAPRADDGTRLTLEASVELEGSDKPALIAEWLFVGYPAPQTG